MSKIDVIEQKTVWSIEDMGFDVTCDGHANLDLKLDYINYPCGSGLMVPYDKFIIIEIIKNHSYYEQRNTEYIVTRCPVCGCFTNVYVHRITSLNKLSLFDTDLLLKSIPEENRIEIIDDEGNEKLIELINKVYADDIKNC